MKRLVGVIGLGNMGGAFAGTLLGRGWAVHGYDLDPGRSAALEAMGGQAMASINEAAAAVDVVITSLPGTGPLNEVGTALCQVPHPLTVIETSTLAAADKEVVRRSLAAQGHVLLDCPVSGTGLQALQGDVVVYASGDRDAYERCADVLDGFARAHHHVGAFGNGMTVKLIANLLVAVHNASAAEAIVLGRKAGIDLDLLLRVIADGAGTSRMLEVRGPAMAAGTYGESTANLTIFRKDLALIDALARSLDCPTPQLATAAQLYHSALGQGRGQQDGAAVYAVLAQMAGFEVDDPREGVRS